MVVFLTVLGLEATRMTELWFQPQETQSLGSGWRHGGVEEKVCDCTGTDMHQKPGSAWSVGRGLDQPEPQLPHLYRRY